MAEIKIAVSEFALPLERLGSLRREGGFGNLDLGQKIHDLLQDQRIKQGDYESEVPYQHVVLKDRYVIQISGRADGVFGGQTIEEIKSTGAPKALHREIEINGFYQHPYSLQLLTYGHIHFLKTGTIPKLKLTIAGFRGQEELGHWIDYDHDVYNAYFEARLDQIVALEVKKKNLRRRRKTQAKELKFPFSSMRQYQSDLIESVRAIVKNGGKGLIQAPTGIGKTIGLLLPTLGEALSRGSQTIYATPKNSQFRLVENTIKDLSATLLEPLSSLTLTAKSKLCLNDQISCQADHCSYARDFYTKITKFDLVTKLEDVKNRDREALQAFGEQHQVCPYYMAQEVVKSADVIICDYNYVYSPRSILPGALDIEAKKLRPNLLTDEFHNLYERALEYYSPQFGRESLQILQRKYPERIKGEWGDIINGLIELIAESRPAHGQSARIEINRKKVLSLYQWYADFLLRFLAGGDLITDDDAVLELFFRLMEFASVAETADENSVHVYLNRDHDEKIAVVCCDASGYLKPKYEGFHVVLGFSATLKPFDFYQSLCGFDKETVSLEMPTPFPDQNRKLIVIPQVSTAYKTRHLHYQKIAQAIIRIAREKAGHYFVFLPSYGFLEEMAKVLREIDGSVGVNLQKPEMDERDLNLLCDALKEPSWGEVSFLLGVQGGRLAEGLDIHSPYLNGVFVVGPAIPLNTFERNLRRDFYESKFGDGFAYAYVFPAMAKSIQAAGRVIRSEEKRGLIILMDQRFLLDDYALAMPSFWFDKSIKERAEQGILSSVREFWGETTHEVRVCP